MSRLETKYAIDEEGAHLSCFDPEVAQKVTEAETPLHAIAVELATLDEEHV